MSRERSESSAATRELLSAASTATDDARRTEFREMFEGATSGAHFYERLKSRALKGLKPSALRSIYWMVFLQVLNPTGTDSWLREIRKSREEYAALQLKNTVHPSTSSSSSGASTSGGPPAPADDLKFNNPLSLAKDSPWGQYWQDNELCASIRLDLERTYPDHEFFTQDSIQAAMLNILFIWAKMNPTYGYRQGMNEILAPMMLVFHRDARAKLASDGADDLLTTLLDDRFLQHDVYACFRKVMVIMGQYFGIKPVPLAARAPEKKASVGVVTSIFADSDDEHKPQPESAIVSRCNHIHHTLLNQCDPGLYAHLQRIKIQPQLYLLRWVRLLFSREYHIEDVTTLWDAIFAYNDVGTAFSVTIGFQLVDYICIAMCLFVRSSLLEGDESYCLSRFLKFPPVEDVGVFVERALILLNPRVYAPLPPAVARAHGDEAGHVVHRTPYQAIGPSVVHDFRGESAPSDDAGDGSVAAAGKKILGALTKLIPSIASKPAATSGRGKYEASITHHGGSTPAGPSAATVSYAGAPGLPAPQPSVQDRQIHALNRQVGQLTKLMGEMGIRLDGIVGRLLQAHAESDENKTPVPTDLILQTVAEVKHVRDVLGGRLSPEEILGHLSATKGAAGSRGGPPSGPPPRRTASPPPVTISAFVGDSPPPPPPAASSSSSSSSDTGGAGAAPGAGATSDVSASSSSSSSSDSPPVSSSTSTSPSSFSSSSSSSSSSSAAGSVFASPSALPSMFASDDSASDSLFGGKARKAPAVSSKLQALFADDDKLGDEVDTLFGATPSSSSSSSAAASERKIASAATSSSSSSSSGVGAGARATASPTASTTTSLFGTDSDPLFSTKPKAVARDRGPL